jgi:hypothetical protein
LRETNANATLIEVPPHTTGLAFDIFYRYMNAAEQTFIMSELARLQDDGRIEALRENRDHYHVFAFAEGRRPDEDLIKQTLKQGTVARRRPVLKEKDMEKKTAAKSKAAKSRRS